MDNIRIPKIRDGIFHRRSPVGRPQLRWEENIRRDSSLLLNIREWRTLAGGKGYLEAN